MDDFELELKNGFLDEAAQLLEDTEQSFLDLEKNRTDASLIDKIFRCAHNLKGTSRAVGFGFIAEFTHEVENLILKIKENKITATDAVVNVLLECNDHTKMMISGLKKDLNKTYDSSHLIEKIKNVLSGNDSSSSNQAFVLANDDHDEKLDQAFVLANENSSSNWGKSSGGNSQNPPPASSGSNAPADETIRVNLSKIELLNNYVGELVILQSVLDQLRIDTKSQLLQHTLSQLGKISKEIQDISMGLRMIPIKQTFQKLQRIIRDTSKVLNKTVNLKIVGDETEVDKTVLELINDPLVHIVRNAVDHGLETTADRKNLGKTESGNITMHAYHEGTNLVVEITDDGKGLDPVLLKKKAIEKGLISPEAQLTEDQCLQLIFLPGFSTKDQVSEVSGRGVGMDVVKSNINSLSGDVKIQSEVGKGSVFKIYLPLTTAIIDGMIILVGNEKYVVPRSQVFETVKVEKENLHPISGLGEMFNLRGETLPVFRLSKTLNRKSSIQDSHQIAIIVRGKSTYAVIVDEILYQQQVVIKKLGHEIRMKNGFIGSSILGDGLPTIILDLYELFNDYATNKKTNNQLQAS